MAHLLWTQKQDVGPSARSDVAMVFDAARSRVVLFGGAGGSTATLFNEEKIGHSMKILVPHRDRATGWPMTASAGAPFSSEDQQEI